MWKKPASERRSSIGAALASKLTFPISMARSRAWAITILGLCIVGVSDVLSGQAVWFGPAYLMIIGFAAWSLGWREAVGTGLTCLAITLPANGFALYPYGAGVALWNLTVRVLAVLVIIALLDNARKLCERQWLLARTDPLTGALNRQAFFELADSIPYSETWCVLVYADLDGLKRLNDHEGHARGDHGLKAYSTHVKKLIRKDDVFARIGGDEFLVYLAVRDEAAGKTVATRLHQGMNEATAKISAKLRCSIGALILAPGPRTIGRELRIADELMYEAKGVGASLRVATVRDCRGTLYVSPDWSLSRSFGKDETREETEPEESPIAALYEREAGLPPPSGEARDEPTGQVAA